MPLIGAIDSSRAQQVIETLLAGVAASRATTAILDITGVQVVDTQAANALLRAAQAVKLLGAQVVLTGIRPEIAQTLVGLGLDLGGITTRATLQSGIAFALMDDRRGTAHRAPRASWAAQNYSTERLWSHQGARVLPECIALRQSSEGRDMPWTGQTRSSYKATPSRSPRIGVNVFVIFSPSLASQRS
jgi:anti-anti-sigma factor